MQPADIQPSGWSVVTTVGLASGAGIAFVFCFLPTCRENREVFEVCLAALTIGVIAVPAGLVAKRMNIRQPEMAVIALLYLSSFVLPSFCNEESFGRVSPAWDGTIEHYLRIVAPSYGLGVSAFLWSFFLLADGNPAFVANPLCWFAFYLLSRQRCAIAASLALVAVSLGCVGGGLLIGVEHYVSLAPAPLKFKLSSGYYVWLSSLFLVGASATVRWAISARKTVTPEVEQC
ncbi:MAG: hypothetical protein HOL01_05570 [Planctomycetaceae bacterium]|jgi:hypothetical protein|nr:hypothetical protein [Planctomycetaceae bacterium]MBT6486429.1 hypothetical protein [Planctomycetaceae bacterium]MBT6494004.1 hypothetical protein [Planctomycetaceae bacterium]